MLAKPYTKADFPPSYSHSGYDYKLIHADDELGLYEAIRIGRTFYEIIKLKWSKGWGDRIAPGWKIPGNEDWGKLGWTTTSKDYAMRTFAEKSPCEAAVA